MKIASTFTMVGLVVAVAAIQLTMHSGGSGLLPFVLGAVLLVSFVVIGLLFGILKNLER